MITAEQAQQYLQGQGIELPDFILAALVEQANSIDACLAENYSPATALLIKFYILALMGMGQGMQYIASQTAPSGASRSFRHLSFAERWKAALALLRGLDTHGCADGLIPQDPTVTAHAGLWVAKGGCN
jgi:hypothetical protein